MRHSGRSSDPAPTSAYTLLLLLLVLFTIESSTLQTKRQRLCLLQPAPRPLPKSPPMASMNNSGRPICYCPEACNNSTAAAAAATVFELASPWLQSVPGKSLQLAVTVQNHACQQRHLCRLRISSTSPNSFKIIQGI